METRTEGMNNTDLQMSKGMWTRTLRPVFRLIIGIALLAVLAQFIDPAAIWKALRQAQTLPLVVASILTIFNVGFQISKWHYLLKLRTTSATWKQSARSFFFGMTLGLISPGQLGEFGGRAWRSEGQSPLQVIGLAILDRLQTFFVICLGGLMSTAVIFFPQSRVALTASILLSALTLYLFFQPHMIKRLLLAVGVGRLPYGWARDLLSLFDDFKPKELLIMFLLTTLFYAANFLQLHYLVNAFSPSTLSQSFLGFSAMMLYKSLLPISFGDLGVREAASVFVFSLLAVPKPAVFNASLLLFGMNILLPAFIGLFFLPSSSRILPRGHNPAPEDA